MSNKLFTTVSRERIPLSVFPAGGERKLSMNMGAIVPIYCKETLPGDTFRAATEILIKFAPLKAPVMHRIRAYVDYFFVPNFQLTDVFGDFINPAVNTPSNPVALPVFKPKEAADNLLLDLHTLADYLDLPVQQAAWKASPKSRSLSVLPFMAYQHIYNSFFRDQTLQPMDGVDPTDTDLYLEGDREVQGNVYPSGVSPDLTQYKNLFALRYSAWKKDYFTSALPTPQAGPDVEIPFVPGEIRANENLVLEGFDTDINVSEAGFTNRMKINDDGDVYVTQSGEDEDIENRLSYVSGLEIANTSGGLTVNNFRQLFAIQHFKELYARGGKRYPEVTYNFFGVRLPDLYVDRPAYLGGMYQDVSVGEVLQTSQSTSGDSGSAQGYRAGVASVYGKSRTLRYMPRMHGFIFGLLRVLPEATYMQGIERMWTRDSVYDFAWPQFANIGEQEIYNRELYVDGTDDDDKVFGYAPRYAEYKDSCSHVNGDFRTTLKYWHFGRSFNTRPQLNDTFIKADQISTDPFNVTDPTEDKLYVHLYTKASARRPLPFYGTPGLYRL